MVELAARGTKRRCQSCGAPYYDLNHNPPVCPKCHAPFAPVVPRGGPVRALRAQPKPDIVEVPEPEDREAFQEDEVLETMDEDDHDEPVLGADSDDDNDDMRE